MKVIEPADLRRLALMESSERAFVSCYINPRNDADWLRRRCAAVERMLEDDPDDLEYFREGMKTVSEWLDEYGGESEAVCVFACFALDFVEGYRLPVAVERMLRIGPAPAIRPLAEFEEEHDDFVFVAADNDGAEIYFVSSAMIFEQEQVKGDIKNHVKKGGWSQKRYQRRRRNELLHYAKDVVESLEALFEKKSFSRLVVLGSMEARDAILDQLSERLSAILAGEDGADLGESENELLEEATAFVEEAGRRKEKELWKRIKSEHLGNGLAETGWEDVWFALSTGRADHVMLDREVKRKGYKCRACENVTPDADRKSCRYCKADDGYDIDLVDEVVRQAQRTSAEVEFSDPIEGLSKLEGIACLTRY